MKTTLKSAVTAAVLSLGLAAWGQGAPVEQPTQAPRKSTELSSADLRFIIDAATGGLAEIEMGKLALKNGESHEIKEFGQRLINDHQRVNRDLTRVALKYGVDLPNWLADGAREHLDLLAKKRGTAFDQAFAQHMVEGHQQMLQKFRAESQQGQAQGVREFATSTLPALEEHLRIAQGLSRLKTSQR